MIVIGLTDPMEGSEELEGYAAWVRSGFEDVEIRRLSCEGDVIRDIAGCHGLILSGGGDVHPRFYGRVSAEGMVSGVHDARDLFEIRAVMVALATGVPILGICRGMQLCNVALGGTLIPDLMRTGSVAHPRAEAGTRHRITVWPGTILKATVRASEGMVNSVHHQGVDRLGEGLRASARADDGVIEALEWNDAWRSPFLLLVQWHPEQMDEPDNPFSRNIIERYAAEITRTQRPLHQSYIHVEDHQ